MNSLEFFEADFFYPAFKAKTGVPYGDEIQVPLGAQIQLLD